MVNSGKLQRPAPTVLRRSVSEGAQRNNPIAKCQVGNTKLAISAVKTLRLSVGMIAARDIRMNCGGVSLR